jgi:hypothetical protein
MIRVTIKHKEVLYVGAGTNKWNNVHIDDLVDLYTLVFAFALNPSEDSTSAYERFYWGSVAEHVWGDVARELVRLLYAKGLVQTDVARGVEMGETTKGLLYT